jgi:hypothetical protein
VSIATIFLLSFRKAISFFVGRAARVDRKHGAERGMTRGAPFAKTDGGYPCRVTDHRSRGSVAHCVTECQGGQSARVGLWKTYGKLVGMARSSFARIVRGKQDLGQSY